MSGTGRPTGADRVRVFVYGSLLPGEYNHGTVRPYVLGAIPGKVRGRLADVGPYPALILGTEGLVRGLWMEVRREGLARLDELEEFYGIEESNDYERVWLADADDPSMQGWGYAWSDDRGFPLADAEWWPDATAGRRSDRPDHP